MSEYTVKLENVRSRKARASRHKRTSATSSELKVESVPLPQIYNTDEAAEYLGLSREAVLFRLNKGMLPGKKHLGRWIIRAVDLAEFVAPNNLKSN